MKRVIFITLAVLLILPLASAEIFISQQPNSLYNIGDFLTAAITIKPSASTHDFFSLNLLCSNKETELLRQPIKINAGQEQTLPVEVLLDPSIIGDVKGKCTIVALYSKEKAESLSFELSKNIEVTFLLNSIVVSPEQTIKVEGTATKANGEQLNGIVEVAFTTLNIKETAIISNSSFESSIKVPKNTPAQEYEITAYAYEKNTEGKILNSGSASHKITVKQEVQEIEIAIETPSISPNQTFLYKVHLYDQTGIEITKEIGAVVLNPQKEAFEKSLITSGTAQNLSFETSSPPGLWQIQVTSGNLTKERTFIVEEFFHLTFDIINTSLIIKNTGNVKYTKPIEISIGSAKEIKDLSLDVGELKYFNLFAPDGEYNLVINDGKSLKKLGKLFLTGQAVSVQEPDESSSKTTLYVWFFSLIVLAFIIIMALKRLFKKGYLTSLKTISLRLAPSRRPYPQSRQYSLIDHGEKQEAMVLSLYVKNLAELESSETDALETLKSEIDKAKKFAAKSHEEGNSTLLVFPIKEQDSMLLAVQVGKTLEEALNTYNQSHQEQISFGLGLHTGTIIAETKTDKKLHFTAIGNVMTIVKRIASNSNKALCLSEQAHRKLIGKIKCKNLPEKNVWQVIELPNRGIYDKFIKGFLKRQEFS